MRLSFTLLLGLTLSCVGLAQQQQLADQLVRQAVVLRNFYTGQKLKYDANGVLISGGTAGSGPADGRVYVEAAQLQKNRVIIHGERPISVFNPATGETSLLVITFNTTKQMACFLVNTVWALAVFCGGAAGRKFQNPECADD